ncbi:MAG TPA: SurA N-terminal domain-containing protein [Anaeromyxobacteraceae bacterium]|nr:SurA N-terminal domain-containing protein [Anaeromyxobacteraceae bacterium]
MLDTLRANSRSVLTYVLFGIIIVVFVVSFGPGSKGCGSLGRTETWAARVNGTTIPPGEFEQQFAQLYQMYRQQGQGELNPLVQLRIRQMALDQIVQRELIGQEAARHGIVVTDKEVASAIQAYPAFQTNNQFDFELYKRLVAANFGSPAKYEDQMRRDLAYQKMLAVLRDTARVSDEEVVKAWRADSDKANLEFARFPLALAKSGLAPSEAQVNEFADKNGPSIEKYYKDNPSRFDRKKEVRARHILIRVDPKASAADVEAAKKRIEAIAERIKKGEDFAKVASEVSEDPGSKSRGGDLGKFGQGVMTKTFEDAAFALKAGQVSDPVRTPFGWHLIKVEEVQEPEVLSLDKARPEIAKDMLVDDLAKKLALDLAQQTLHKLQSGKSFAEALPADAPKDKKGGAEPVRLGGQVVKPEETGSFSASSSPNLPRLGPDPELFAAVLKASAGEVLPKVFEGGGGFVVARVKERERPNEALLASQKAQVETRLRLERESQIERAWIEGLRKSAKIETNSSFLAGNLGGAPAETD